MDIITFIFLLIVLGILTYNIKFAKRKEIIENAFSLSNSKGMQGIFALFVIMHHTSLFLRHSFSYNGQLKLFENIGVFCIGFFFFCSGYGLIVSLKTKENYLDGFIKKRIFTVLVPFFMANYIYIFVTLLLGVNYSMKDLFASFFGLLLLNSQMWFPVEIMILYLLFYFVFKFISNEKLQYILIGLGILVIIVVGILSGHCRTYSNIC